MRVLVVDDDRAVRDAVRRALTVAGHEVAVAPGGAEALEHVARSLPDAIVLDVGMPGVDGLEVCRRVRRLGSRVPILMLSGHDEVSDRIGGLEAGADDYLVKPFDIAELRARTQALLRRAQDHEQPSELCFAELHLDRARHGAVVGEAFAKLTRTEFSLLELLLENPRRVLAHSLIYERVWGYDFGAASNALRVYIGYLRRKLARAGARPLIHTVRGVGYVLREP